MARSGALRARGRARESVTGVFREVLVRVTSGALTVPPEAWSGSSRGIDNGSYRKWVPADDHDLCHVGGGV